MNRALLVIAKHPIPGQIKSRLSPPFSPQEAADLYSCFLEDILNIARHFLQYLMPQEVAR